MTPVRPDAAFLHSAAALISTGDELIFGQSLDTNSRALSALLVEAGVPVVEHVTLGDDRAGLAAAIRRLAERVPLVIVTGGLGPTLDDLTREALADVLRETLIEDEQMLAEIAARRAARLGYLGSSSREHGTPPQSAVLPDSNRRQAMRPPSARTLRNPMGTAPGLHAMVEPGKGSMCDVVCLPGPPREWEAMWPMHVEPMLRLDPAHAPRRALVHLVGLAESDAATTLGDLMDRPPLPGNPTLGITAGGAGGGVLTVRVRSTGALPRPGPDAALDETVGHIRKLFGEHVLGEGEDAGDLAGVVIEQLKTRRQTLAVAESCTGGGLGRLLTNPPGASAVFQGGFITYSNDLKHSLLGIAESDLDQYGAVSEPVARAMAEGAARAAGTTHALSITGIAGPEGGLPQKPVGTVYIAHHDAGRIGQKTAVRRFLFPGNRDDVRDRSAMSALALLHFRLRSAGEPPRLLWEYADAASK